MQLRAEAVSKEFIRKRGESNVFPAVQETDFTLAEGAFTILKGASGSGKSTLLNMLAGLLVPTRGKITLDGTDLYAMEDRERSKLRNAHFGVIPQGQTALHSFNVLENVLLPFMIYGEKVTDKISLRALSLLEKLQIADLKDVMPSELSGGELRRVCIARALVRDPEIILADEPTGDLDEENTSVILNLFKACAGEGKSVLMVTHEKDIDAYADHLYHMNKGMLTM